MDEADKELNEPPRRRKMTEAEKEALRQKRLREKFGETGVDPYEPPLPPGIGINPVRYAYTEVNQLTRRRKRIDPEAIAERVALSCHLEPEVRGELSKWIEWLRHRRYLLIDGRTSPVILWVTSKEPSSSRWDDATRDEWAALAAAHPACNSSGGPRDMRDMQEESERRKEHAIEGARELHKFSATRRAGQEGPCRNTFPKATGRNTPRGVAPDASLPEPPATSSRTSVVSPISGELDRPQVPLDAFSQSKLDSLANAFFYAVDKATDERLVEAARALSADATATERAMARSQSCRDCVFQIFEQIGLPIPGGRP